MKKKLLTILVSMLFIAMIPSTIGDDCEPEQEDEWIYMRGVLTHWLRRGNSHHAVPIHFVVWYKTSEGLERRAYWFEYPEVFDDIMLSYYLIRMYEVALGLITYFSIFNRGLEPLE